MYIPFSEIRAPFRFQSLQGQISEENARPHCAERGKENVRFEVEAKQIYTEMVVSTHGTPIISWMVYFMKNPSKMYDLGVPLFQETTKCTLLFARLQPSEPIPNMTCSFPPADQIQDEMLWGAPVPPAETIWANAKEGRARSEAPMVGRKVFRGFSRSNVQTVGFS